MFFLRFTLPLSGLLLIAAGVWISVLALTAPAPVTLDALPDYDYTAEIKKLMAEKKYGEARTICEDLDTPEAEQLLKQCDAELKPIRKRLWRSAKAFVSGSPGSSLEEAGAALASDLVMYGDIRDLVQQGYYKVTGKETDPIVAALAGAGLLTELIDAVDWIPALTKALRRAGAISDSLGRVMLELLQKSRKAGKLTPEAKGIFVNIKTLFDKGSFLRTRKVIENARTGADVAHAATLMKKAPKSTHLIARSAGKNAPEVMEKLAKEGASPAYLKRLALKGPAGITLVLRTAKSVRKGNVQTFIQELSKHLGPSIHLLSLSLILTGTALNYKTIKRLCKRRTAHG